MPRHGFSSEIQYFHFTSQSSTKASESAVDDIKDDDDDNDEDEDDTKLPSHDRDPDRLKAFNVSAICTRTLLQLIEGFININGLAT